MPLLKILIRFWILYKGHFTGKWYEGREVGNGNIISNIEATHAKDISESCGKHYKRGHSHMGSSRTRRMHHHGC